MAKVTINSLEDSSTWVSMYINHIASDNASIKVTTWDGGSVDIDWGDGIIEYNQPSGVLMSHTYVGAAAILKIKGNTTGLSNIKIIDNPSTNFIKFVGNISEFSGFTNLNEIKNYTTPNLMTGTVLDIPRTVQHYFSNAIITGSIDNLPPGLISITKLNSERWTGNISVIPASVISLNLFYNSLSGDISSLKSGLTTFFVESNNANIVGNIINLPASLQSFVYTGPNDIVGNLANLPAGLVTLSLRGGNNAITGNLDDISAALVTLHIEGVNLISGGFSTFSGKAIDTLEIYGVNTISGVLANLPSNMNSVRIRGNNTISGNIQDVVTPSYLEILGNNTISGTLSSITGTVTDIKIGGNNTIQNTSSKSYAGVTSFDIDLVTSNVVLIPSQVDQLLNDINAAGLTNEVDISISGPGAVRTAASDAAYTAITGGGGYISLTP